MNPFSNEPAASAGVVLAVIYILAAFGLPIDENQKRVLQENLPIVIPGIIGLVAYIRSQVTPNAKVEQIAQESARTGVPQA